MEKGNSQFRNVHKELAHARYMATEDGKDYTFSDNLEEESILSELLPDDYWAYGLVFSDHSNRMENIFYKRIKENIQNIKSTRLIHLQDAVESVSKTMTSIDSLYSDCLIFPPNPDFAKGETYRNLINIAIDKELAKRLVGGNLE